MAEESREDQHRSGREIERAAETRALEVAGVAFSVIPMLGGPVSAVLSGIVQQRKLDRVKEVVEGLSEDLKDLRSKVSEEYVKTEDFQELLDKTLRRAAEERTAEVRTLYRQFLRRAIMEPGDGYDQQLQVLKVLEEMRSSHLLVLKAMAQPPGPDTFHRTMGSVIGTLTERTRLPRDELADAVEDLTTRRLINKPNTHAMMSGVGAEDLRHLVKPMGTRVLEYAGSFADLH